MAPWAPTGETAVWSKEDSAWMTASTSPASRPKISSASRARRRHSSGAGARCRHGSLVRTAGGKTYAVPVRQQKPAARPGQPLIRRPRSWSGGQEPSWPLRPAGHRPGLFSAAGKRPVPCAAGPSAPDIHGKGCPYRAAGAPAAMPLPAEAPHARTSGSHSPRPAKGTAAGKKNRKYEGSGYPSRLNFRRGQAGNRVRWYWCRHHRCSSGARKHS